MVCIRQVYLDDLPLPEGVLAKLLAPDEHAKAMRRRGADRTAAIAARGLLRVWLGSELGLPPQSLRFVYGKFGKPALDAAQNPAGLCFSVSHSANVILLAMTLGGELGVDVERALPEWPVEEVAPTLFSETALAEWSACPPSERNEMFWRAWVRREACAKARGAGIARAKSWPQVEHGCQVADIAVGGEYRAAVAYAGPPRPVRLCVWDESLNASRRTPCRA